MTRLMPALYSFLIAFSALAEDVNAVTPPEHTNVLGITLVFGLFTDFGLGFFGYLWWMPKNATEE